MCRASAASDFTCRDKAKIIELQRCGGQGLITIVWDLTKQLLERLVSKKVSIKPVSRKQLKDAGKILVITWGGFIKNPETTERRVGPYLSVSLEQPFIAYRGKKTVGCVSPRLDLESKVGILDGEVHVLPEYRRQHIGAALLLKALQWLRNHGMKTAMVTPFNPEGEDATQRAIAFCNSTEGKMSEYLAS